jgi:glutamate/tyrosine decarboxylase-like PLP-dependent enzyme
MHKPFPEDGQDRPEILSALRDMRAQDPAVDGRAFAFIYDAGEDARSLARDAFAACMGINGLDPTVYPSARRIENAVVGFCLDVTRAPAGAAGTATAGGTESVMLAVKAARDHARRTRPGIKAPRMLLPETAHACFHKAAHYLGVEAVRVDVDPVTLRADVADARRKMTEEVILVVGSAPSYAHGVVDPIAELAELAMDHGTLMHVDACVGGWVLPFLRDAGVDVPAFDFTVPGVTSLSLDLHKYGYAPKGLSVLIHRTKAVRAAQYYACAEWSGYAIVNTTSLGSKSVAAMGAGLAVMLHLGRRGYRERAKEMWDATTRVVDFIDKTPGVRVLGRPAMNLLAFTADERDGDVFELADRLTERGWLVQPTYSFGRSPAHIHLTIDPNNASQVDRFTRDLGAALEGLPPRMVPPAQVLALLSSAASSSDTETIDGAMLMGALGIADGRLPERAGPIHRLIEAAPPAMREQLLVLFMGELFS